MKKALFAFLILVNSYANTQVLTDVFKLLKQGSYEEIIKKLNNTKSRDKNFLGTKHYLVALSYSRSQDYQSAIENFAIAIKLDNKSPDLFYEFGQALYAMNELEKAQKAFFQSAKNDFKVSPSNYYIAHIYQLLDQHKNAKTFFEKIISDSSATTDMKQVARFQLTESLLEMARKTQDTKDIVKKHIIPGYEKAFSIKTSGSTAADISKRLLQVQDEFGLNPNKLVSGKKIPLKRFKASFSQEFTYNNNFTLTNDLPGNQQTKADTFVLVSELNIGYDFILKRRYTITPSLSLEKEIHTERDDSNVYSSDGYEIEPTIDFKFAHRAFNNPASLYFNFDYTYKAEDRESVKEQVFNNRTTTYELGEKFKYFKFGESTLKLKQKYFRSYSESLHIDTTTLAFDQIMIRKGKVYLLLLNYDMNDYINSSTNNTDSLLARVDMIWPLFMPKLTLNLGASYTWLKYDDADEAADNGTEKTLSTTLKFTREISKKSSLDLEYVYTKNSSLDEDSDYSSHETTLEYTFTY